MEKEKGMQSIPVEAIKGVGPKIAGILKKRGVETVEDLFYLLPVRYEDRSNVSTIDNVKEGERVSLVVRVSSWGPLYFRNSRKKAFEAIVEDGTGALSVKWFQWNGHHLKTICRKGNILFLSGEVSRFGALLQMIHPVITVMEDENEVSDYLSPVSVYPELDGIKPGLLRNIIREGYEAFADHIKSFIPESIEKSRELITLGEAIRRLHFPDNVPSGACSSLSGLTTSLKGRLIEEEYFLFQSALLMRRREVKGRGGVAFKRNGVLYRRFRETLPFKLTIAQERVAGEIEEDMSRDEPMNRLLQGDVGSGKTICAVLASCVAIDNGYQVAVMAPTEILAEQHYLSFHRYFEGMGIPTALLRGNLGKDRRGIIEGVREGRISVVVGTHALISKDVEFRRLGLAIIDEQHRFGVMQRKLMSEKNGPRHKTGDLSPKTGPMPHILVMSATPIPRTLSMVIYGDLDISVIDELPSGRGRIWTKVYHESERDSIYGMMKEEIGKGNQVYIVYPLVEESDKVELLNATEMACHLQENVFPGSRVDLLHGRMRPEEKEGVMERFRAGEAHILACTTVIEVGIDVPNATMIVVEHAERFGLSQLHQLRGRVGRGKKASRCILVESEKRTDPARRRLKVMEGTCDGFRIAEEDMKIRGVGDMFGSRQSGIPDFRVGEIVKDMAIMIHARKMAEEAAAILTADEADLLWEAVRKRWGDRIIFSGTG